MRPLVRGGAPLSGALTCVQQHTAAGASNYGAHHGCDSRYVVDDLLITLRRVDCARVSEVIIDSCLATFMGADGARGLRRAGSKGKERKAVQARRASAGIWMTGEKIAVEQS